MTDLWKWMERPRWYRGPPLLHDISPKSKEEMTPEERDEWVKALKRSHDEAVKDNG